MSGPGRREGGDEGGGGTREQCGSNKGALVLVFLQNLTIGLIWLLMRGARGLPGPPPRPRLPPPPARHQPNQTGEKVAPVQPLGFVGCTLLSGAPPSPPLARLPGPPPPTPCASPSLLSHALVPRPHLPPFARLPAGHTDLAGDEAGWGGGIGGGPGRRAREGEMGAAES